MGEAGMRQRYLKGQEFQRRKLRQSQRRASWFTQYDRAILEGKSTHSPRRSVLGSNRQTDKVDRKVSLS